MIVLSTHGCNSNCFSKERLQKEGTDSDDDDGNNIHEKRSQGAITLSGDVMEWMDG
jgi:hypothetical protein